MPFRVICALTTAILILAGASIVFIVEEEDPTYRLSEWLGFGRYNDFDSTITAAAKRHDVDPLLVKAVIWQESRFHRETLGGDGERGLMQVTQGAGQDWAETEGIETFVPTDLLDPKNNIEVGTWYLGRALKHWSAQEDPLPFALGEYNAGRSRVNRWSGGKLISAQELDAATDISSTRAYIKAVRHRYEYYQKRGDQMGQP
jgi:soluble lytic murein transglycosylase